MTAATRGALRDSAVSLLSPTLLSPTQDHITRRTRNDEAKAQVCEDMRAQALARAQPTHHLDD